MNRKNRLNYVLFFFLQSCIITQNSDDYLLKPKEINDPIDKKHSSEANQPHSELEHLPKPKMLELVKELTAKDAVLKKEDEWIIHSIPSPVEENSLLEALLVVGFLHEAARDPLSQKDQLKEKDLNVSSSAVSPQETTEDQNKKQTTIFKSQKSLSSIFEERSIDLLKTLENNPFLSGYSVALLALKASEQTSNTIEFDGKIKELFTSRTQALAAVQAAASAVAVEEVAKGAEQPSVPEQEKEENKQTENPENKEALSIEHLFLKAEEMIEDEKFKEAIGFLQQVPKNHPSFGKAEIKIKETANLAVQKLRQKAAKSFQAANPVSDIKARRAYLVEAKKYLEEALTTFQNSEKLETVKQNLEVINRQLENLADGMR